MMRIVRLWRDLARPVRRVTDRLGRVVREMTPQSQLAYIYEDSSLEREQIVAHHGLSERQWRPRDNDPGRLPRRWANAHLFSGEQMSGPHWHTNIGALTGRGWDILQWRERPRWERGARNENRDGGFRRYRSW